MPLTPERPLAPQTVLAVFARTARANPGRSAFAHKDGGAWRFTTWSEYHCLVRRTARGLMALGVEPGQGVVILAANRPEWFLADLGAIAAGALPVGIYTTSAAEQCEYIARHCAAAVAVIENPARLEVFRPLLPRLPRLKTLVLMEGPPGEQGVLSWGELLSRGQAVSEAALDARIAAAQPLDCASLIYTSGTTGPPKAVMLSHRNITWIAAKSTSIFGMRPADRALCYLPLSHVAEQTLSLYGSIAAGFCTYFAEGLEKLAENLREVRPSFFLGVPRVWEKIQARLQEAGASAGPWRRKIMAWARGQGQAGGYAEQRGDARPVGYFLARVVVFSKLRRRLGLDCARFLLVSSAPVAVETLDFFLSLGLPILEIYGMSECTGPATMSLPGQYRTGWAGRVLEGGELRIAEDGEILIRGPHVFLGYYRDEEATRAALDASGWLHSGDVGELRADGYLRVTDRKKELLITSGGKKTGPAVIEGQLKQLPAVAHAVVVGEGRNYLAALFTLDAQSVPAVAAELGSAARNVRAAADCPLFRAHLERSLAAVNERLARFETIKRFSILTGEFTVQGGELTPTLKLRRRLVYQKYAAEIERLYA